MTRAQKREIEAELDRSTVISFSEGIPAFEEEKEYFVLPLEEAGPFFYLKSANSDLCLLMADPFTFFPDYQIDFPDALLANLGVENDTAALMVFCILTLGKEFKNTTANLLAPVIINAQSRKGMQFIPQKAIYPARQPLFPGLADQSAINAQEGT